MDSDAAADSVVDSVAESLVAPVLPGLRTVLPAVARVLWWVAVTSYWTGGVVSDTIYGPSSPRTATRRTWVTTVDLQPSGN